MKRRRITPAKIMLIIIVMGMGLMGSTYAVWTGGFSVTSLTETGELKVVFIPEDSVKCISEGNNSGTKIGTIENKGTVPAYLSKAVYTGTDTGHKYNIKIGNGDKGQILSAQDSRYSSKLEVWISIVFTGSRDDASKRKEFDDADFIETKDSKEVETYCSVTLSENIVFNQANLRDEGWSENITIGNPNKKMTRASRFNRSIIVPVMVMKTFYTYTEITPVPETNSLETDQGENDEGRESGNTVKKDIQGDGLDNIGSNNNKLENKNDLIEDNKIPDDVHEQKTDEAENNVIKSNEEDKSNDDDNDNTTDDEIVSEKQIDESSNSDDNVEDKVIEKEGTAENNVIQDNEKDKSNDDMTDDEIVSEKQIDKSSNSNDHVEVKEKENENKAENNVMKNDKEDKSSDDGKDDTTDNKIDSENQIDKSSRSTEHGKNKSKENEKEDANEKDKQDKEKDDNKQQQNGESTEGISIE